MATQTKATESAKLDPQLIDELGGLEKELAPWQAKIARYGHLKTFVRDFYATADGGRSFEVHGKQFIVALGPKGNQRSLRVAGLAKALGAKLFTSVASVTFAALTAAKVDPQIVEKYTASAQTGPRTLKIFEKGAAGA